MGEQVVVKSDQEKLFDQLESLRKRSIPLAFGNHEGNGPIKIDVLARIVETLFPGSWGEEQRRIEATSQTLALAIQQLPPERLPRTDPKSTVTYRDAAALMFQVPPLPMTLSKQIENEYESPKHFFAKLAHYVRDLSGMPQNEKLLQSVTQDIKHEIARILLKEEGKVRKDPEETSVVSETGADSAPSAEESSPEQLDDAPVSGMGTMNVTVKDSYNVNVGPYGSQTNHIHK
ncbi:hypothetical protein [Nocardia vinacea]|uniref:hypothetical protein n=1 Tax=Nocardia vinacea TaxID=96468 RepID=UPI0005933EC5|nr:hypothetical protein [Nocardia vinacea]